jgi:hypothetical protein
MEAHDLQTITEVAPDVWLIVCSCGLTARIVGFPQASLWALEHGSAVGMAG